MVDTYGRWTEEKDYSTYPKEKWCDYDEMAVWIRKCGYEPKTTMENLITNIFMYFEELMDSIDTLFFSIDNCIGFVETNGGLSAFDFEP